MLIGKMFNEYCIMDGCNRSNMCMVDIILMEGDIGVHIFGSSYQ